MKVYKWITYCCLIGMLNSCHKNDDKKVVPVSSHIKRTVLVYQVGQNTLGISDDEEKSYLEKDVAEIEEGAKYVPEDCRLLVYSDDKHLPRIREYSAEEPKGKVVWQETKDLNSSDGRVLERVLKWTQAHYRSDEYGYVLCSHADGWLPTAAHAREVRSFGIDVGPDGRGDHDARGEIGAQMEVGELAMAIKNGGKKPKYVFFDACLMQNIETVYALRDVTDYVVGSPISIPAAGSYYPHQIRSGLFAEHPQEIVKTYYEDVTDPELAGDYGDFGIVMSCVATQPMNELCLAFRWALPHSYLMDRGEPRMSGVTYYQTFSSSFYYRPYNYDALEAVERIFDKEAAEKVASIIRKAVVYKAATKEFYVGPWAYDYNRVNLDKYSGVALFVPRREYDVKNERPYGSMNRMFECTEWYHAAGWKVTGW